MKVLVTGALGPAGSALMRQLRQRRVDVVGVDMAATGEREDLFVVPPATSPAYLPTLHALLEEHAISLLIPTVSEELVGVSSVAPLLPADVAISPVQGCVWANDKLLTMWQLSRQGVAVPRFATPGEPEAHLLGDPFIVKPRVSRGGRGVRFCSDPASNFDEGVLLQEFASGEEFCPMVYLADDPTDDVVVSLRKTSLEFGVLGNATGVVREPSVEVEALARAAGRALGLRGAVDLDIRYLASGQPVVLEVNARFGANSESAPEILDRCLTPCLTS